MNLKESNLDQRLVKDLDTWYDIHTVEMLYRVMKKDSQLFSRYLLKFQLDYDKLLKEVEDILLNEK